LHGNVVGRERRYTSAHDPDPDHRRLAEAGHELATAGRNRPPADADIRRHVEVPEQSASTDWSAAVEGTEALARQTAATGAVAQA
jgi:hypothetical protein